MAEYIVKETAYPLATRQEVVGEYRKENGMEKVYVIKELYDVDGGFGDAIPQERIMAITRDEDLAKAYVEKYNKPQVYDVPYAELVEHVLTYEAFDLIDPDLDVDPWAADEED